MRILSWFITLPLILFAVVFALSNRQSFSLSFFPYDDIASAPLFVWLFAFFLIGFVVGGLIVQMARLKDKNRIRRLKKAQSNLNKDVEKLNKQTQKLQNALQDAHQNSIDNPYFLNDNPDITPLVNRNKDSDPS